MIIEPCRLAHLRAIASNLRYEERAECALAGAKPRHMMIALWKNSSYASAALLGETPIAAWGDAGPSLLHPEAWMWLFTTPLVETIPVAFFRQARREVAERLEVRQVLRTSILASSIRSVRFWSSLGFTIGQPDAQGFRNISIGREVLAREPDHSRRSPPFIIYALPRSRTKWLSVFLTYRGWTCYHEQAVTLRSAGDIRAFLAMPRVGTAETAAGPAWHLIHHYRPDIRAVVVRRPVAQTVAAMIEAGRAAGVSYDRERLGRVMNYGDRCLDRVGGLPGVLTVQYHDLDKEETCQRIFEHCLPFRFDREWWLSLKDRNIQVEIGQYFHYYRANRDAIEHLKRDCKTALARLRRSGVLARA